MKAIMSDAEALPAREHATAALTGLQQTLVRNNPIQTPLHQLLCLGSGTGSNCVQVWALHSLPLVFCLSLFD